MRQLPLDLRLNQEPELNRFVPGPNTEALAAVRACAAGAGEPYLYLWGEPGTGRTHLLLGACRAVDQGGGKALYLDLATATGLEVGLVQDLDRLDLVALNQIQTIAADRPWLEALFELFNRLRASGTRLLVAADRPPAQLDLALPDLGSRLAWGPSYRLRPLDDGARLAFLQAAAQARGLRLAPAVARYILHRCPRDPSSLEDLLNRLDLAALSAQRSPSIPLVRDLLEPVAD